MAYRGVLLSAVLGCGVSALGGCGGDTGILVGVGRDPATAPTVDQLQFLVGTPGAAANVYLKNAVNPDIIVDVAGRDLAADPYKLLFHDVPSATSQPAALMVMVLGLSGGRAVAIADFDQPQPFVNGAILERDLTLAAGTDGRDFHHLGGCLIFGNVQLVDPTDPKCGGDCAEDSDCDALPKPVCGGYVCDLFRCKVRCPNCTDGDGDGYGVGTGCAGLDCDDTDPTVTGTSARDCHDPANPVGVGACRAGTQQCVAGAWGPCSGEVRPSGEACNGEDDDCNGQVDDGLGVFSCGVGACAATVPACTAGVIGVCAPGKPSVNDACDGKDENCDGVIDGGCGCVKVATTGDDTLAVSSNNATPFATVEAAVAWAAAGGISRAKTVCVASGAACNVTGGYSNVALVMANGIDVYGQYESTGWTRCSGSVTVLSARVPEGVLFPSTITAPTALDGFQITRVGAGGTTASVIAGVTVDGAKGASLRQIQIIDAAAGVNVYGVNVINGGDATISGSAIEAGLGTMQSIGVRASGSRVTLQNNCAQLDTGNHCAIACTSSALAGLHGRGVYGTGESYAVLLENSPGSIVASSALCQNAADTGAGLRIKGDGTGVVVSQNSITASGGVIDSHGVWAEDCNDAAPWIVDNAMISTGGANSSTRGDGIRAVGRCHPVIDSNVQIIGGAESGVSAAIGVYCGPNANGASQCVIVGNKNILGSGGGVPPSAIGVRCDDASCSRVALNTMNGHGGQAVYGMWLGRTGALVDRNQINGGCAVTATHGLYAADSFARVQNNRVSAGACQSANAGTYYIGLRALAASGGNEIDVNGNDLDSAGPSGTLPNCIGVGLALESMSGAAPSGPAGIFRNNIVRAGTCATRYVVAEKDAAADPRLFENNDLDPFNAPTALYFDEATTALTLAQVNALGAGYSANISVDAGFVSYPNDLHLLPASMCIGQGTPAGAPAYNMDGNPRLTPPNIGAD